MKFAICNEMFEGWELSRTCEFLAGLGYSGMELTPFTVGASWPIAEIAWVERKVARRTVEDAGLEVVGLHWLLGKAEGLGLHVNHPDPDVRRKTADYYLEVARLCADVGGKTLAGGSPKQRSVLPGLTCEEAWRLARDTYESMLADLRKLGVIFCLEPLGPEETNFINSAAEATRMADEIDHPNFQVVLDVKAMATEGQPIAAIIRANATHLRHFHANDASRRGPGFGDTDFKPILAALEEVGYDGFVSIEVFDYAPDPETIARESLQYLRGCIKS